MPEIKHTFSAAKMNKDLDERLVPNGEYRDAMNIQVRTTSGDASGEGDAGTVQNIQGNKQIYSSVYYQEADEHPTTNKTTVVGSVANEKNNTAYFFVAGLRMREGDDAVAHDDNVSNNNGVKLFIDNIIEVNTGVGEDPSVISSVVVDKWGLICDRNTFFGTPPIFPSNSANPNFTEIQTISDVASNVRPGMTMTALTTSQSSVYSVGFSAIVFDVDTENNIIKLNRRCSLPSGMQWGEIVQFLFEAPRVLNFDNRKNIPAIKIIDDLLFWTDNKSEPKRINVKKCKLGTTSTDFWRTHTKLVLTDPRDPFDGTALFTSEGTEVGLETSLSPLSRNDLREEHVTVIRKSPRMAPTLEMSESTRGGQVNISGIVQDFLGINEDLQQGDTYPPALDMQGNAVNPNWGPTGMNWQVNDILTFTEMSILFSARGVVRAMINAYNPNTGQLVLTIISLSVNYAPASDDITDSGVWNIELEDKNPLFELKFGRFGCRYKYDDGEYSTFSPWSELAFLPGSLDYNHKKGYNLGMVNNVRSLKIKDFIPHQKHKPDDVVAVDLLWKTTESPNVYVVKTIKRGIDGEWNMFTTGENNEDLAFGEISITSEMIHKVVEKNQLLRAWDNVPRRALAQEIAANRIVFSNYVQGYHITDSVGIHQNHKAYSDPFETNPTKSIKTIRDYKWGMVFGDKYGRETPVISGGYLTENNNVFSMESGDVNISKQFASMRNTFELKQMWNSGDGGNGTPDEWMEYVKYYVKETSNEYYNLIMDRWYNAEDGNLWISFASADRNKIDEETYLILKKEHGSSNEVVEKARYKVIAIEPEAPDFIKFENRMIGSVDIISDDYQPDQTTGNFGVFDDQSDPQPWNTLPQLLMQNTALLMNDWNGFLDDYRFQPKGDLQVRVIGRAGGITLEGRTWQTITYYGTASDPDGAGIIRWREPFWQDADMLSRFTDAGVALSSGNSITYAMEFRERVVVNAQPQFDGKFFVKIEKDDILEAKVMKFTGESTAYQPSSNWLMTYIDTVTTNPAQTQLDQDGVELNPRFNYTWFNDTAVADLDDGSDNEDGNPLNTTGTNVADVDGVTTGFGSASIWQNLPVGTNAQNAAPFMALGCDNAYGNNLGAAFSNEFATSGGTIPDMVNWGAPTRDFWNWREDPSPAPEGHLRCRMWVDSARAKWMELSGPNQQAGPNNNDGTIANPIWRDKYYYKPTGIDPGVHTDGSNVLPTINNELGRIAISMTTDKWTGFNGPSDEQALYQHMTQVNNRFMFVDDPNAEVYQIVDCIDRFGVEGSDVGQPGEAWSGLAPPAKNYSKNQEAFDTINVGFGGGDNGFTSTPYQDQDAQGNAQNIADLSDFQGLNQPTLANIIVFGGGELTNPWNNGANWCNNCELYPAYPDYLENGGEQGEYVDTYCRRSGFRVEFRRVDQSTGTIISDGGIQTQNWDPRGQICHDGREAFRIAKISTNVVNPEISIPVDNAAVFETEPKEDVGLDIWYEASNAIPMWINRKNGPTFTPYHSKVTIVDSDQVTPLPWGAMTDHRVYFVGSMGESEIPIVGIEGKVVSGNSAGLYRPYMIIPNGNESSGTYLNPHYFVFEHKDGTKTMAKIGRKVVAIDMNGDALGITQDSTNGAWIYTDFDNLTDFRFYSGGAIPMNMSFFIIEPDVWRNPIELGWFNCYSFGNGIESDRIRDDYNAPQIDNGVKVSTTFIDYGEERKGSGMIYSGIYNSISGVNNLNEFNQAEKITKDLNPSYGSIQALKTRDTNVVVFTEDKVLQVTTNKDALFNADGNPQLTATNRVLGTAVPFSGDYGISNNPESLAWDQFRLYFTDMQRGAVLRLSGNGITPISNVGMKTYFRDNLKKTNSLLGTYDTVNGEYNLTLKHKDESKDTTVSFNEASKGWVSFKSFIPQAGTSVGGKYITGKQVDPVQPVGSSLELSQTSLTLWEHHVDILDEDINSPSYNKVINRNVFYAPNEFIQNNVLVEDGVGSYFKSSSINILFNDIPSNIKSFNNVNYEGSQARIISFADETPTNPDGTVWSTSSGDGEYYNLNKQKGWFVNEIKTDQSDKGSVQEFINKEGKWFNNIDGGKRGDITNQDLNEFSVQGIGMIEATTEQVDNSVEIQIMGDGQDD